MTEEYKLDFDRDHTVFAYSFAYLGDERKNSEAYRLLMKIANNNALMNEFQSMVYKHIKEHEDVDNCLYCLIAIQW